MGYYKSLDKVYLNDGNFSGLSTASEMKKRGVDKETCVEVENKVVSVELLKFYEVSGAKEYGVGVYLECTLSSGDKVKLAEDGMNFLSWIKTHTSENGIIKGDFILLFKGVVVNLEERNSVTHKKFIKLYEEQENKNKKTKSLEVKVGDVVNIHGSSIYLGEFYYYKPNLKNTDTFVNQLRKYKLYIQIDKNGDYINSELHVESGKTKYNQPTEIFGNVNVDMDLLKKNALEQMENMFKEGIGYKVTKGYGTYRRALKEENSKSYVLSNISSTKEKAPLPDKEDILKRGWLCGWDYDKKTVGYKKDRSGRTIEPYQYDLIN